MTTSFSRPQNNKWIAGVCAGIAERFDMGVGLVRFLFVLSCLLPGTQVLIYILLWVLIPKQEAIVAAPVVVPNEFDKVSSGEIEVRGE